MPEDTTTQCWLFPGLSSRRMAVSFDEERGSSDGGAILLKAADARLGLTRALADRLCDSRDPERVTHELREILQQRVFGLACGYPDGNDSERLADDPVHKMLLDRDPVRGERLASQPTISRFENSVSAKDVFRVGDELARSVVKRHRQRLRGRARRITIDLDQMADLAHGGQQLALFNGYYENTCYLPLLGFVSFDNEPDHYLFAAVLRPGNSSDKRGAAGVLRRIIALLREDFPEATIRVRLDSGFAGPEIFNCLEEEGVEYVVGLPKNSVLERRARRPLGTASRLSRESGESERVYADTWYAAGTWTHRRRVIIKAEVTRHPGRKPKKNPRFVVTNLDQTSRWIYEKVYCKRGDVENRIKELQLGLEIDRTSCSRFLANQLRVLMTAAAYVLMQELRIHAARTGLARAQVWTLRSALLKIGTRVTASARRIVLHLPTSFPFLDPWGKIAARLGAQLA